MSLPNVSPLAKIERRRTFKDSIRMLGYVLINEF